MTSQRRRLAALASTACLALLGTGCGLITGDSSDATIGDAASDEGGGSSAAPEIEGVRNFYGEYGDYATLIAAVQNGETSAEELDHPWVAQQDHVDAAGNWDGTPPTYELTPPAGGSHLSAWQTCSGVVYDGPIVDGNAVHSMEHGAVWLTYDPDLVSPVHVAALAEKIEGRDYSLMSPYPGQGVPVSLQSWGNQYQTEDPSDANIDAYLEGYVLNEAFNPEINATCSGGESQVADGAGQDPSGGAGSEYGIETPDTEELQELIDQLTEGS